MNIYLFGNNEKINHELIKKFNFQSNDLIVLFNKSILTDCILIFFLIAK